MLPSDVRTIVEAQLGAKVTKVASVAGGCISNATRVDTDSGPVFLKWSPTATTFSAEADGLEAIERAKSPLRTPSPLYVQDATDREPGILIMEWIEPGSKHRDFWPAFGRGLAILHRTMADRFGFERDNFIGRLPQPNRWTETWSEFFLSQRLDPQVRLARERALWDKAWDVPLERLFARIGSLLPAAPEASLLHGDLWGGNFLIADDGRAALVDPAPYFGHREADLGMTELFGGFDAAFYAGYREEWPLEPGYAERRDIYNLYHLINHLNHFGSGYAASVAEILMRF